MKPKIKMFQTAFGEHYTEMIQLSAAANLQYCSRHGIELEIFIGLKRGYFPWQATFNRIVYLKEQMDVGYDGWIFYLDADAYVKGQDFDVRELISREEGDLIFSPGGLTGEKWDVNAGVFLINVGSDAGKALIKTWHTHFMGTTDKELSEAPSWNMVADDQERLHDILRHRQELQQRLAIVPREVLNDENASFVRQILRANASTTEERLEKLKCGVAEVLSGAGAETYALLPSSIHSARMPSEQTVAAVTMFQTADSEKYAEMIAISSPCNRKYCETHGLEFERFLGIKRGFHPWQACFNRIVYLKQKLDEGYAGWVFYLDADAYVYDHEFDVRDIISRNLGDYYFAPGGLTGHKWDVNDGVFLINLGSEPGKALVEAWYNHFMGTSDHELREAVDWNMVPSDQPRLHEILRNRPDLLARLTLLPREVFNNEHASFVRQVLRSNAETLEQRIDKLRAGVGQAMSGEKSVTPTDGSGVMLSSGRPALQNPAQYGSDYDTEFRRILREYGSDAASFLEWGAGYTTRMIIEHIGSRPVDLFLTIDNNAEYLEKVVQDYRHLDYLSAKTLSMTGPCENDRDAGLNYSTYPLSLERHFDFIFIDGRRRMECAMMALLLAKPDSVIVMHDYRRVRYQVVHAFFRILEDGPQFRVMVPRVAIVAPISDVVPAVMAKMNPAVAASQFRGDAHPGEQAGKQVHTEISRLSAADALGLAHRYAVENELAAATAMAELALVQPKALGESEANARVLLASLRERQGQFELAARSIAAAARLSPNDEGIMADQERILAKAKQSR